METEKAYKDLSKKHSLPDFSKLNNEFEVSSLEVTDFLLREIVRRMSEKIEYYTMLIDSLLQPDSGSLAPLHECRAFDDKHKEELFSLYKLLMQNHRSAILAILSAKEEEEAKFIAIFFKEWIALKPSLIEMLQTMRSSWVGHVSIEEEQRYFG
jgi:hypothetical protein